MLKFSSCYQSSNSLRASAIAKRVSGLKPSKVAIPVRKTTTKTAQLVLVGSFEKHLMALDRRESSDTSVRRVHQLLQKQIADAIPQAASQSSAKDMCATAG